MRRMSHMFFFVLFVALAHAGEDNSKGWIEREKALKAAKEVTPAKYPNSDEVLVAKHVKLHYKPDGTYTQWHEEYVKVITEKGRRGYRTLSSYFTIPYQQKEDCTIPLVEIIKPDGKAVAIDVKAQSKLMINPGSMRSNIYNPNDKILRVNIPGLEVGDVLHFVMFDRIVKPRMKATWCDYVTFEGQRPIVEEVVEISEPKELPLIGIALKDKIKDSVKYTKEEKGGRTQHRWVARKIPRMFPEPSMPPAYRVVQRLLVSTVQDWPTISRWYWNLSEPHFKVTPEIVAKVQELTKGLEKRRAKIEAIFTFVSQKIRYMGITTEDTAPGYEPHDVKDTFAQKHGVCRDKAALLVAMLRQAGFDAFPTLIHNGPKKDVEIPQPYFNHAITAVKEPDGSFLLMDSTDETTQRLLPSYLNNKSFLVATPKGEKLMTSPIVPAEKNLMHIDTTVRVLADGSLKAKTTLRFDGINDNAYRGFFARVKPERRRRYFEGVIKAIIPGSQLTKFVLRPENMTDTKQQLTATLEYEAKDVLIEGADLALLPLPLAGTRVGMANFLIGRTGLKERKYPLVTDIACGVQERLAINLAPELGKPVNLPTFANVETDGVDWKMKTLSSEKGFVVEGGLTLKVVEFSPKQYLALKGVLKTIERDLRKMAILRPKAGATAKAESADIEVLDEVTDVVLKDAQSWTTRHSVKKKVVTYAGKKRGAEVKLAYNTGWEEVKLERAEVTAADGTKHQIKEKEINTMDQGWVGTAKRYPAAKTLVASLPSVDTGCTTDVSYTRTRKDRPFFSARVVFGGSNPIHRKRVTVTLPTGFDAKKFRFKLFNGEHVKHTVAKTDAGTVHAWEAIELPATRREDRLPPSWAYLPTLFISTGDWAEYARTVNEKLKSAAAKAEGVADLVTKLTEKAKTDEDKIRAFRDHVAKFIRHAGPGLKDLPLSTITDAGRVLSDGYGNSSDRAVLLHAMLTAAGYKPRFVLPTIRTRHPALRRPLMDLPSPMFSTVLVALEINDIAYFLNDTNQYQDLDVTAHEDCLTLELDTGKLRESLCPEVTRHVTEHVIDLGADGAARIEKSRRYRGTAAGHRRRFYAELTPEKRRRHYLEMIAGIAQAAEADGDLKTDTGPGRVEERFAVKVPGYAVRDGDYLYCRLPASLSSLVYSRGQDRYYPYYSSGTELSVQRVVFRLPKGFEPVLLPRTVSDAAPLSGLIAIDVERKGGEVTVTYRSRLEPSLVATSDYAKLLDLQRKLRHPNTRTLVLKAVPAKGK